MTGCVLQQGYCGLETLPLPGRMDSRDDIAAIVSNTLNPLALHGTKFTSLTNLIAAAQPQIGSKVCSFHRPPQAFHSIGVFMRYSCQ